MFRAVLDTCTLWPSLRRDVILTLASARLFEPTWSPEILEELEFHEHAKLIRRGMDEEAALERSAGLIAAMQSQFPGASTDADAPWIPPIDMPDPDDAHVVKAAAVSGAGAIVTENVKDFPAHVLPPAVDVITPADFIADAIGVNVRVAYSAIIDMLDRHKKPPMDFDALLALLEERYGLVAACELLRSRSRHTD